MAMRFGFQTHVRGTAGPRELFPGLIDVFVAAEELGFSSGWVAQHHLESVAGRLPSPLVLLAAVAARTRTIGLGTSVVVLPLEDPLRVAEDAAVVDALSGGRLQLGLGAGGPSAREFAAFGRDPQQRRELYAAHRDRLLDALAGVPLAGGGRLQPDAPGLADRIWESPSAPERAAALADTGRGLLVGIGPGDQQRGVADAYRGAGGAKVAAFRGGFPALSPGGDRESQAALIWPDVRRHAEGIRAREVLGEDPDPHELLRYLNVHYGSGAQVAASVATDPLFGVATEFNFTIQTMSTSISDAIATLQRLAAEVIPQLQAA